MDVLEDIFNEVPEKNQTNKKRSKKEPVVKKSLPVAKYIRDSFLKKQNIAISDEEDDSESEVWCFACEFSYDSKNAPEGPIKQLFILIERWLNEGHHPMRVASEIEKFYKNKVYENLKKVNPSKNIEWWTKKSIFDHIVSPENHLFTKFYAETSYKAKLRAYISVASDDIIQEDESSQGGYTLKQTSLKNLFELNKELRCLE